MATLWMGDLEAYMDEVFILSAFEQLGEPASQVKLIQNRLTGLPAGYCFIDFPSNEFSQRAMLRLNGKIIPNSQPPLRFKLNSSGYSKESNRKKEFSLFVGELTEEVDDYLLYTSFSKRYPSCRTAKVVIDLTGRSRGYGFVRFADELDQQKALIEMQNTMGIGRKPIRISLATPRRQRNEDSSSSMSQYSHQYPQQQSSYYGNQAGYYGYGGGSYQDYSNYYHNYYSGAAYPPTADDGQQPYIQPGEDQDVLEDPELEIDVDEYNKCYMQQSEELYTILDECRWNPSDQWDAKPAETPRSERHSSPDELVDF